MKKILIYGLDGPEADKLQNAAEALGFAMYTLGDSALEMSIEDTFALQDDMDTKHDEFPDSYMLFDGFELSELVSFLLTLDKQGCSFDGIKVMRTELNENWTLRILLREAAIEQDLSQQAIVLRQLLRSCKSVDQASMNESEKKEFRELVKTAERVLESESLRGKDVEGLIARLRGRLKNAQRLLS